MISIDGKSHKTIKDAAAFLKVSEKTVRVWIDKGILPKPPEVAYGTRSVPVFSDAYLRAAARSIKRTREEKSRTG